MTEPWFSSQLAPYFSLFSLLAAMASLQRFAERGTHRNLVLSSWYAAIGFGALMLVAALVGLTAGQPGFVVGTLAFTGAVVVAGFASHLPRLARLYREAELRGTIASDL
jgi:hypothetical protein